MAELGYIALVLAFMVALYSVAAYVWGARNRNQRLLASARNALLAVAGLTSVAVLVLATALFTNNFSIEYVASYSGRDLSFIYRLSALWAGNKGSLLFWAWSLSVLGVIMVLQRRSIGKELVPYAAAVVMFTQAFFLLLLIAISNPFVLLPFTPAEGRGLNPLLENPGMVLHPPALLGGYVGFTIPFAFAIAALMTRRLGDEWLVAARRWTIFAWLLLGLGNVLGAWWAYRELGWGGFWAWDPVENAGLMPWLVGTAFLHSIMMQRRRGILKVWNMVLIILAFSLAIFGTFLTRSGILSSVHTFGESALGPFFLVFLGITLVYSFGLVYYRHDDLQSEAEMESMLSRESTFLLNNLLLVAAAFAIFLGTIFPILAEAVRGVKITVGPPFFNQVNAPIFLAIILLTGVCALIGWRRASLRNLVRNFLVPLIIAVLLAVALVVIGVRQGYAVLAFSLCAFVVATILYEWVRGTRARHHASGENLAAAFINLVRANRPRYGGYIVHIAIMLIAAGVVGSTVYSVEKEATLKPGESMSVGRYVLTYSNLDSYDTQSKQVYSTTLSVENGGEPLGMLVPEKYFHHNYEQPVTEVAIRSTFSEDLYVILEGWDETGSTTTFKALVKPLVSWIWAGGLLMLVGGLISFWPDGRRAFVPTAAAKEAK